MLVKFKISCVSNDMAFNAGMVYDLPAERAVKYCEERMAELVKDETPAETRETKVKGKYEKR